MVAIPAGPFVAGEGDQAPESAPDQREIPRAARSMNLPAFVIDRVPVTVRDYAVFVFETRRAPPAAAHDAERSVSDALVTRHSWANGRAPEEYLAHPAVLVTWDDAAAYCAWRRARLPTENEWEKAQRGTDARVYPWGGLADPARLNSAELGPGDTTPVLTHPRGVGPFGLSDGSGNTAEWTSSPAPAPDHFIARGGAWNDPLPLTRLTRRRQLPRGARSVTLGFRCASNAPP